MTLTNFDKSNRHDLCALKIAWSSLDKDEESQAYL